MVVDSKGRTVCGCGKKKKGGRGKDRKQRGCVTVCVLSSVCVCQAQTGEWVRLVWQNNLHELSVSQQQAFK